MKLVAPSVKYKKSFLSGLGALYLHAYKDTGLSKIQIKQRFPEFVKILRSREKGLNLPKGYVPDTTYWLVKNNRYIGSVDIRHRLNQHLKKVGGHIGYEIRPEERKKGYGNLILKLALSKAKKLKLKKVLLTCDATNIASQKIILANGGKLANRVKQSKGLPDKLKFWINLYG